MGLDCWTARNQTCSVQSHSTAFLPHTVSTHAFPTYRNSLHVIHKGGQGKGLNFSLPACVQGVLLETTVNCWVGCPQARPPAPPPAVETSCKIFLLNGLPSCGWRWDCMFLLASGPVQQCNSSEYRSWSAKRNKMKLILGLGSPERAWRSQQASVNQKVDSLV